VTDDPEPSAGTLSSVVVVLGLVAFLALVAFVVWLFMKTDLDPPARITLSRDSGVATGMWLAVRVP
jgi:flagellar biogenesis protein FliO